MKNPPHHPLSISFVSSEVTYQKTFQCTTESRGSSWRTYKQEMQGHREKIGVCDENYAPPSKSHNQSTFFKVAASELPKKTAGSRKITEVRIARLYLVMKTVFG